MIGKILSAYRFDRSPAACSLSEQTTHWSLHWMIRGNVKITLNDTSFPIQSGQLLLLPPGCSIRIEFPEEQNIRYAVTSFGAEPHDILDTISCRLLTLYDREQAMLLDYFYTATQLFSNLSDLSEKTIPLSYSQATLEAFLLRAALSRSSNEFLILPEHTKVSTHTNAQMLTAAIKEYLEQHLSDTVTLDTLAQCMGSSKNTMMRFFREDTGMGIMEYFTRMKIDTAIKLICESDLSFRSISEKLGFQSPEYFSRVFKKYTGLSPTEFSMQHTKWQGCLASISP